ncbi:MAG: hypothetical protein K9L57_07420 [Spirochaetaceae bacterium]|nr:hypothetical protein [Spirochaetaceae bacterium]
MSMIERMRKSANKPEESRLFKRSGTRGEDSTITQYVYGSGKAIRIVGDTMAEWTVIYTLLLFEDLILNEEDLQGEEKRQAASIVLETLRDIAVTRRGVTRENFSWPYVADPQEVKERKRKNITGLIDQIGKAIDDYILSENKKSSPIPKAAADTMRAALYAEDDHLWDDEALMIAKNRVDRYEVAELIRRRAEETIFTDFSGLEFQCFFELYRRWHLAGRPERLNLKRNDFLQALGYYSTGTTREIIADKIRDTLYSWSKPDPYKIVASENEVGEVNLSVDVRLPVLRENRADKMEDKRQYFVSWTFSDFDRVLFPSAPVGGKYHQIPTRPFRIISEKLGNTQAADNAKHAAALILVEKSFGRKRDFSMSLDSLHMKSSYFSKHEYLRDRAFEALREALHPQNLIPEMQGSHILIRFKNDE